MRVLFTTLSLASTGGVEMYLLDLSRELLRRGWQPCVYAPTLGPLADRFREATVPVYDDLRRIRVHPDIIHGNFGPSTCAAACRFSDVPVVSMCHAWHWNYDLAPLLPNVYWHLAVDETCRERLYCQGVPPQRVRVLPNAVDLVRFVPRGPLPDKPRRALALSNYLRPTQLREMQAVCRRRGLTLDGAGRRMGNPHPSPESLLPQYDVVFAKGRCAWEALATGCAVIVADAAGLGPMVTTENLAACRRANFGCRLLTAEISASELLPRLDDYDPRDAAKVSRAIRQVDGLTQRVEELMALYQETVEAAAGEERDRGEITAPLADYAERICRAISAVPHRPPRASGSWSARVRSIVRSVTNRFTRPSRPLREAA